MFPEMKLRGTLRLKPIITCFVIPPNSKIENKTAEKPFCLMPAGTQICPSFKEHDLITCESEVQVVISLGS